MKSRFFQGLFSLLILTLAGLVVSCGSSNSPTSGGSNTPTATPTPNVTTVVTFSPVLAGNGLFSLAIDNQGNLYGTTNDTDIVKRTAAGVVSSMTVTYLVATQSVMTDSSGNVYFSNYIGSQNSPYDAIYKIPSGSTTPAIFINGLSQPEGLAVNSGATTLYEVEYGANINAFEISPAKGSGLIAVSNGGASGNDYVACDANGNLFYGYNGEQIWELPAGSATTVLYAGTTTPGFANGSASTAQFNGIGQMAADSHGNLYEVDYNNSAIREISGGVVSTLVGSSAQSAKVTFAFSQAPSGLAVDGSGNVYFAVNQTIYEYQP